MALSKIDVANMLTGVTPVANGGSGRTAVTGNILQIQTAINGSDVTEAGGADEDDVFSDTITLSSTSNYILAIANINYQFFGNSATTTPECNWYITDGSNNKKAYHQYLDYLNNNSSYHQGGGTLIAYWSPGSTSEQTVKVRADNGSNGRIITYGSGAVTGRASRITLMEISA
jgi:hypothetical protein